MQGNDEPLVLHGDIKLAIFDVDSTFVHGDSFKWFCWFALKMNGISLRRLWVLSFYALMYLVGRLDAGVFKTTCLKVFLTRYDNASLKQLTASFLDQVLVKRTHTAAVDRLRWHRQQNHTIVFLSASPDLYLIELGARFGVDHIISTNFLNQDGKFTGELFSANCKGQEKRRRLLEVYSGNEIDWNRSYGYGNSVEDVSFLEIVGHAVAVNPGLTFRKLALQRKWMIETWNRVGEKLSPVRS